LNKIQKKLFRTINLKLLSSQRQVFCSTKVNSKTIEDLTSIIATKRLKVPKIKAADKRRTKNTNKSN
jgi:hypothetical protein